MQNKTLVIATKNQGKVREFKSLLEPLGFTIKCLADFAAISEIVEDGDTFYANALKKAKIAALELGLSVIADDSGLCVDALDDQPGVRSARYAGEDASDALNNQKLLTELKQRVHKDGGELSKARFVCALVLYNPEHEQIVNVEGTCSGFIISEPQGEGGFGYDPLFYLPEFKKTMAELTAEEKNKVSHRGSALRQLLSHLE
jgi:XTP/dITP diphosphohydrolase